jgi:hypothetical protein
MLALTAYPVLANRRDSRELGGAQVQQVMIARALVRAGIRVTFICMDYGQPEEEVIDGIRVIRTFNQEAGIRGLRFFHPRLTGLASAMARADADVYYQRCSGMTTGIMTAWCRMNNKASIYAGASDLDFQPGPPNVHNKRDRWLFRRGLRDASAVVIQNPRQRELLQANYGREGVLIPSCYATPSAAANGQDSAEPREVLWIGMIRPVKRPDRFLALAKALPDVRFRMIGGAMGDSPEILAYYAQIEAEAAKLPNLTFMGFVPFEQADSYFDSAHVVVNTSEHEGFPNTFLQAWSRKVPSVALFDTGSRVDGVAPYGLVQDEAALQQLVRQLVDDPAAHQRLADLGHTYFQREHSPETTAQRYLALLQDLTQKAAA